MKGRGGFMGCAGVLLVLALGGCAFKRYETETPRSATEQLLVSGAIEDAVEAVEWPELSGRDVSIDVIALNEKDASYLKAVAEARARALGSRVVAPEEAELHLELLAGAIGTVSRRTALGIPSLSTPFGIETPSLILTGVLKQRGYVKLGVAASDPNGNHLAASPTTLARRSFEVYSLLFLAVRRNDIYPGEGFALGLD